MVNDWKIIRSWNGYGDRGTLAAPEKINWRVEEIIGGDRRLDFTKPFIPEALARVEPLAFLTPSERLALNQIRGNGYINIFGLFEEFILPFVLDYARAQLRGNDYRVRAFLQFANEQAKHIHLFGRFREEFERGFGSPCEVIGPASEISRAVLSYHPLAVALTIVHIGWMTQSHYLESAISSQELDPQFKNLLKHHWMEEAHHAKLNTLMVEALASELDKHEVVEVIEEYLEIGGFFDGGFKQQVDLDLESLERATGRTLSAGEREEFIHVQLQANRWTFLGSALSHPKFLTTLEHLQPEARKRIEQLTPTYC